MTAPARWWAPAEPGIGPDPFDLSLLTPGPQPEHDLGQAFLALHRVGAAACEAVATQPLADESVFCSVLAKAREMAAPEAVNVVSKSLGDAPYAGLLVRDVLDDAEGAALSLYRSCLAANVPPSAAAHRVGLVYGVPAREIGTFQKAATDPKTPEPVLVERADRLLFGYLAKLVEEEGSPTKINKAQEQEQRPQQRRDGGLALVPRVGQDNPATPYYDARDAQGQFTTDAAQETKPASGVKRRKASEIGSRGGMKSMKTMKTMARAKPALERSGGRTRTAGLQRQLGREAGYMERELRSEGLERILDAQEESIGNQSRTGKVPGNVTEEITDDSGRSYGQLNSPVVYVLAQDEWNGFKAAGKREGGNRTFRAGHLERFVGDGADYKTQDGKVNPVVNQDVATVAARMRKDPDVARQSNAKTRDIDKRIFDGLSPDETVRTLDYIKKAFLEEQGVEERYISSELRHVHHAPVYDRRETTIALVYTPPPETGDPGDRPVVEVTEVVVEQASARGYKVDARKKEDSFVRMDPNVELTVPNVGTAEHEFRGRYWDPALQVFRSQVTAWDDNVDPSQFSKAMDSQEFAQLERAGRIRRDAEGQFTSLPRVQLGRQEEAEPVQETAQRPQRREMRQMKSMRAMKTGAKLQRTGLQREGGLQRTGVQRKMKRELVREGLQRSSERAAEAVTATPVEDRAGSLALIDADYLVLAPAAASASTEAATTKIKPGQFVYMTPGKLEALMTTASSAGKDGSPVHNAESAVMRLSSNALDAANAKPIGMDPAEGPDNERLKAAFAFDDVDGLGKVADYVMARQEQGASVFRFAMVAEYGKGQVEVYESTRPTNVHTIVRLPEGEEKVKRLVFERSSRIHNRATTLTHLQGLYDSAERAEAPLDTFFANPVVRVWRAEGD